MGHAQTETTKEKIKIAMKGNKNGFKKGQGIWTGKKRSEETKEKIKQSLIGKKLDGKKRRGLGKTRQSIEYRNWQKNLWGKRKREADGTHTYGQWEELKAKYNWTCPACKKKEPEIKLSEDHIVPLSKGGSDNIENIQPLCRSCNCKKLTKTIKFL